jgi:ClpP class serine protease
MGILDLLWIYFVITSLQPVISQRVREWKRGDMLRKLQERQGGRFIALIHRQETMSLLGFPVLRYINIEDSEEILRAIKLTGKTEPINLIIHTPGGLVLAARQIAHALGNHEGKVTVYVPHYAMSGGTLIALAADQIVMDPNAVLGPVDPQLNEYPAASIIKAVAQKDKNKVDDQTLILADISEKAITQLKKTVHQILKDKMGDQKAQELSETLATGRWTHDYPLTHEELSEMGLPVSIDVPEEVYSFMALFPQPKQSMRSVEYLPVPAGERLDRQN